MRAPAGPRIAEPRRRHERLAASALDRADRGLSASPRLRRAIAVALREQRVEAADARPEHLRHDALDVALRALREQRDVERDLARRDLGDGGGLADDGVVGVAHLGRADQRALIVGDDDEAMLPELLERLLVEPVAEHLAGKRGQLGVREDDDVDLPLRGALQLGA